MRAPRAVLRSLRFVKTENNNELYQMIFMHLREDLTVFLLLGAQIAFISHTNPSYSREEASVPSTTAPVSRLCGSRLVGPGAGLPWPRHRKRECYPPTATGAAGELAVPQRAAWST